jgi:vacuolar-type H+-ATPase subunit D/Vma8
MSQKLNSITAQYEVCKQNRDHLITMFRNIAEDAAASQSDISNQVFRETETQKGISIAYDISKHTVEGKVYETTTQRS